MARYGAENKGDWSLSDNVERSGSSLLKAWWQIGKGKGKVGILFKEKQRILVGKGERTYFWSDL